MKKYDIFVSFSHNDIQAAERVVKVLEAYKKHYEFEYFLGREALPITADYLQRISDAITDSRAMIFLATEESYKSAFCSKGLLFAENRGVTIYRYCLDKATAPNNIELLLIDQHRLDSEQVAVEQMVAKVLASTLGCKVQPLAELTAAKKQKPAKQVTKTPQTPQAPQSTAASGKKSSFWGKLGGRVGWALLSAVVPIMLGVFSEKIFGREFDDIVKSYVKNIVGDDGYVADLLAEPNRKYRVGDFVTVGGVEGVVFQTKPQIKVVSAVEGTVNWGPELALGATDDLNGKINMAAVQRRANWKSNYSAFQWCAELGDGWYLPAIEELGVIYENKAKINKTLQKHNFVELGSQSPHSCLWSSCEEGAYSAGSLFFSNGEYFSDAKSSDNAARAVFALGEVAQVVDGSTTLQQLTVYNIGDLVTIEGVQGVVFQTSPEIKVISVLQTEAVWSKRSVSTGAKDEMDGRANMAVIQKLKNWKSDYPAFSWCAGLGEGWYLPAFNELSVVYEQRERIDKTLVDNGLGAFVSNNMSLWSSTEYFSSNAFDLHPSMGFHSDFNKGNVNVVRAVRVVPTR